MRKFLTRLLLVFLSAVICLSGVASAADTSEDTLRVGLFMTVKLYREQTWRTRLGAVIVSDGMTQT